MQTLRQAHHKAQGRSTVSHFKMQSKVWKQEMFRLKVECYARKPTE